MWFIGAGPGAPDLLTIRAAKLIGEADVVVWARSLVNEGVLEHARAGAEIIESTTIPLEGVRELYERAVVEGLKVARVHSGDPSIYGAVMEQAELCEELGLQWEIVPGVSSLGAAAAAIGRELTVPEVSQSVILTRRASRTPMPEGEEIRSFASHGTTMAIFLSAARPRALQEELLEGGYAPETPCAVVYRASWPDEVVIECPLKELAERIRGAGFTRQALILVGPGLGAGGTRSHLYSPRFSHMFRKAEPAQPPRREPMPPRSPSRKLREPSMPPSMARARDEKLRTGWTTGTCAAAAAKAAAWALLTGEPQRTVDVRLPKKGEERRVEFEVERWEVGEEAGGGWAEAVVVKDAGDDPDVTDGAHLTARISWRGEPGLGLDRGEGVGVVTKPGLGLPVGGPAINEVPRRMISYSVAEVLNPEERGVRVEISVPGGEEMAEKTTNARLGIVGGISILGTTGIVRPFSTAAWAASVVQAVNVMGAQGNETFVLSTGGLTERAAMRLLPDLDEVCFIEVGDFTGQAIKGAVKNGLRRGFFVGMAGKLAKLAAGVMMTHWTRSKVDNELLAEITREAGGSQGLIRNVSEANTARHAYELWRAANLEKAPSVLCERVAENLTQYAEGKLEIHAIMVDFDTLEPVGASPGALELTTRGSR